MIRKGVHLIWINDGIESCSGMGTTVIPRIWGLPSTNYHGNDGDGEKHHSNTAVMGLNQTVIPRLWMCVLPTPIFTHFLLTYLRLFTQQSWHQKKNVWRGLASVARGVLGVPATSTSFERSFSLAGRTIEERRSLYAADWCYRRRAPSVTWIVVIGWVQYNPIH